jgi:hypothetical protein
MNTIGNRASAFKYLGLRLARATTFSDWAQHVTQYFTSVEHTGPQSNTVASGFANLGMPTFARPSRVKQTCQLAFKGVLYEMELTWGMHGTQVW